VKTRAYRHRESRAVQPRLAQVVMQVVMRTCPARGAAPSRCGSRTSRANEGGRVALGSWSGAVPACGQILVLATDHPNAARLSKGRAHVPDEASSIAAIALEVLKALRGTSGGPHGDPPLAVMPVPVLPIGTRPSRADKVDGAC